MGEFEKADNDMMYKIQILEKIVRSNLQIFYGKIFCLIRLHDWRPGHYDYEAATILYTCHNCKKTKLKILDV